MADPYGRYQGRGDRRYEYPADPDYGYYQRNEPPPEGYDRRYREYDQPGYDPNPRPGVPREYPRAAPIRAEEGYGRRGGDYPPGAPRGGEYIDPAYYPPPERGGYRGPPPPAREHYAPPEGRGYPPAEGYRRGGERDYRRGPPPPEDFDARPYGREYEERYRYEDPPAAAGRRPPPANDYREPPYDPEREPVRVRRVQRDPPANMAPEPEDQYYEFDLPADGIRKEVLQRELTLFLGGDATMRGPMQTEDGSFIFKYRAYRQLTREQIKDLKKKSARIDPGFPRGGDPVMPPTAERRVRRPAPPADDDPVMMGGPDPNAMDDSIAGYVYAPAAENPTGRGPRRGDMAAGRMPLEGPYGTQYETGRGGRREPARPIPDDDEDMEE